jgi:hypothetical protein
MYQILLMVYIGEDSALRLKENLCFKVWCLFPKYPHLPLTPALPSPAYPELTPVQHYVTCQRLPQA